MYTLTGRVCLDANEEACCARTAPDKLDGPRNQTSLLRRVHRDAVAQL
jgi:hypothetical protein